MMISTATPLSRWFAPLALAAGLGMAAMVPTPARASDDLVRVIVDVADVVLRGGQPYYRHGGYGYDDRLIVVRDRYGRPVYYRQVPRHYGTNYRPGPPPHARAYGYRNNRSYHNDRNNAKCDRNGRCTVRYYDPRYDRDRYDRDRYDRGRHHARWDGRRR